MNYEFRITLAIHLIVETDFQLGIIIPAFNEELKLDLEAYNNFLSQHQECFILFVNDCSTDNTLEKVKQLESSFPEKFGVISNDYNLGKATSVQNGMNWALENVQAIKFAYLDADLATSLEECLGISQLIQNEITFVFGSRILTINANIERRFFRHFVGRIIATAISNVLQLKIYDTQCGCKVFEKDLCKSVFKESFISRWLFDVEIIFRVMKQYGRKNINQKMLEQPLKSWIDRGKSSVKLSYFFKLWLDLYKIKRRYRTV